jgi:hypothetical protein
MEATKIQDQVVEVADVVAEELRTLNEHQLALIGGGIGSVVFG